MSKKILIVDDSKFTRNLLKISLERLGYWVEEVGNPSEAVELVKQKEPDMVISDLKMPELMDGLGFLRVLALEAKHIPVLVYTSDARAREDVGDVGLDYLDFLIKPASPDKLKDTIASIVNA